MYPEDCLQSSIAPSDWWTDNAKRNLCRGALIIAFIPHVDQIPNTFELRGRKKADQHDSAELEVKPLRIDQKFGRSTLPVAGMPLAKGEVWVAHRAKKRPCLVISSKSPPVDHEVYKKQMPKFLKTQTVLAAPYYGARQSGKRVGYRPELVEQIRHCTYPQFLWDKPPQGEESILRLDQLQPVSVHHNSYKPTDHKLSDEAMEIVDELLHLLIHGKVMDNSWIAMYKELYCST